MKNRRDRIDIIISILESIEEDGQKSKPTHVLYRANLSHKLLKKYLQELEEKGFISFNEDKTILLLEKGKMFLSELRKMKRFMDMFNL
ncbi:MAG: hypothetical protein J7K54_05085 [Candidatus Aenigmarchaeota archaeon]|nr:hypothetical protein [Candidatus Aenigmarchaeota archaeon]